MGKRKNNKKRNAPSRRDEPDTDDENVYDKVDLFHKADRELKHALKTGQKSKTIEVLNVEGDYSDDEQFQAAASDSADEWDDAAVVDGDEIEEQLPSREDWGKKKSMFYSTSYVDKDFGGAGDEQDERDAELEEEDATTRQRALDAAAADLDILDDLDDDAEDNKKTTQVVEAAEAGWNADAARKKNKETVKILKDYNSMTEKFEVIIKPLLDVEKMLPKESPLKMKLLLCANAYGIYLDAVCHYLSLKAKSLAKEKEADVMIDEHPILNKIWRLKEIVDDVDAFVGTNSDLLSKLISLAAANEDVDIENHTPIVSAKQAKKIAEIAEAEQRHDEADEEEEGDARRGVNYTIEKNKAQSYKKKTAAGNSKLRKRQQFKKAVHKQHSQKAKVRTETSKYSGEARGIRISTIKSIKLKA